MKKILLPVLLMLLSFLLVACGGGGGSTADTPGVAAGSGLPDLVVTAFSAPATASADGTYTVTGTVTNQGEGISAGGAAVIYLSPFSDVAVDGSMVGMAVYMGILENGQSWNFSTEVHLPKMIANGNYHLGAVIMYADETDKKNNSRSQPLTIGNGTTCTSDSYEADNSPAAAVSLPFGVAQSRNHCDGTSDWLAFSAVAGRDYGLATTALGDSAVTALALFDRDGSTLLANGSVSFPYGSVRLRWQAPASGTYYLRVSPYHWGDQTDYQIMLGDERPDLTVPIFAVAATKLLPGGIIYVDNTVKNQGFADATPFTVGLYLSLDAEVTKSDLLVGERTVSALAVAEENYARASYTLPANLPPGPYYLAAIADAGGIANEYATTNNSSPVLRVNVEALAQCSSDLFEEDDLFAGAGVLVANAPPQSHNHCDDMTDWLRFTANAGESYALRLLRSGLSRAGMELYAGDGTTLLAGDYGSAPTAIDWQAPADGTYYLKINSMGELGAETDYTVQLQPRLADLVPSLTLGKSTVIAGDFLSVDAAVSNIGYQTAPPFAIGFYRSPDSAVTIADTLVATRLVSTLPVLAGQATSQSGMTSLHFPKELAPGTYSVAAIADYLASVTEGDENNNVSPPLNVTVVAPPCALDLFEDDDSPASAQTIVSSVPQTRNFCDDGIDWMKFMPATSGAYLAFTPSSLGSLELYGADGVTRLEPQATSFASKLSWIAIAGSEYYLKYYRSQGATSGSYQFSVSPCTQDLFEEDDTLAAASTILVGATQNRNHCEDKEDWAKFTATAGTAYTMTATNGQYVNITLYDGLSPYSLASGQSTQGGKVKVITWTAPASGTYYLKADRFEFGLNTDYTLKLN